MLGLQQHIWVVSGVIAQQWNVGLYFSSEKGRGSIKDH